MKGFLELEPRQIDISQIEDHTGGRIRKRIALRMEFEGNGITLLLRGPHRLRDELGEAIEWLSEKS